jgi:hypothetical protein
LLFLLQPDLANSYCGLSPVLSNGTLKKSVVMGGGGLVVYCQIFDFIFS